MPGSTTRGFRPGPIAAGRWSAELGLAAIASRATRRRRRPASPGASRSSTPATPRSRTRPTGTARYRTKPGARQSRLVRGRPARPRRALGARRRDDARDVRLRAFGAAQARLHHAHRLRDRLGVGRDRPPSDGPAPRRALVGGHHLPRAHQQPALGPLRRLPHRPGVRPARRRRGDPPPARPAREPDPAQRSPRGRLHAAQPPDDLPVVESAVRAAVPRLPVGLLGAGDRLPARGRDRGQHGSAEDRRGAQPVHHHRDRLLRAGAGPRCPRRRGRCERLPQRGPHERPDPVSGRDRGDRRVREGAERARDPLRGQGGAHLREARRRLRPGPALHGPRARRAQARDLRRQRPRAPTAADARAPPATASCSCCATAAWSPPGPARSGAPSPTSGRYGLRLVRGQFTEAVGTPIWFRAAERGRVSTRGC